MMPKNTVTVTPALIRKYAAHLHEQEHSSVTIEKYVHDLTALSDFLAGQPMTKGLLLEWKENLIGRYAPASVNNKLAAVNGFCPSAAGTSCACGFENPKGAVFERGQGTDKGRVCTPGEYRPAEGKRASGPGAPDHLRHRHPGVRALIHHHRSGVPIPERQAVKPEQYLEG